MAKVLVTGGCGFIGSNFIEYLLEKSDVEEVINVDLLTYAGIPMNFGNDRYTFYHTNIGDARINEILDFHNPDYIINFAAETHVDRSISDPHSFVRTNILATYNFICSVQEYYLRNPSIRFVHVSTDEVYGQLKYDEPAFTELSQISPNSPYSATKASADHLIQSFYHTYKLPAIIARCSNNYGHRQHPEKFIPRIIMNALQDKPIPVYGTGLNVRDWIYVWDHCTALSKILVEGTIGETYNVGGECEKTNLEVVNTILSVLDKPISLINFIEDRKGHDLRYAMNVSKLRDQLQWNPIISFEEGIVDTVNWYITNMDRVQACENLE